MTNTGETRQNTQAPRTAEELEKMFPPVTVPDKYVSVPGARLHPDAERYYRGEATAQHPIYRKLLGKIGLGPR